MPEVMHTIKMNIGFSSSPFLEHFSCHIIMRKNSSGWECERGEIFMLSSSQKNNNNNNLKSKHVVYLNEKKMCMQISQDNHQMC